MIRAFFVASSVLAFADAFSSCPNKMIERHLQMSKASNQTNDEGFQFPGATTKGSLVYIDNGADCDKKITAGFGFTLNSCVVRINEGHGVKYSNCYESGDKVMFTFTECSDEFCKEGCQSYQLSEEKCSSDPEPYNGQVACATNEDAWKNYNELTLHTTEYFGGDADCSGQYGYWSSQNFACTSAYNRACNRGSNYYYFETVCDL